ncbi:hypothetical protein A2U01_0060150, partial [Trifolium medium]|nr:hypothetical protein [Trifolium medium]
MMLKQEVNNNYEKIRGVDGVMNLVIISPIKDNGKK